MGDPTIRQNRRVGIKLQVDMRDEMTTVASEFDSSHSSPQRWRYDSIAKKEARKLLKESSPVHRTRHGPHGLTRPWNEATVARRGFKRIFEAFFWRGEDANVSEWRASPMLFVIGLPDSGGRAQTG